MSLMSKRNQIDADGAYITFTSEDFIKTRLVRQWLSNVDEDALRRPKAWKQAPNFLLISEQDTNEASVCELRRLNDQRCSLAKLLTDQEEAMNEDQNAQQFADVESPMHFDVTRPICAVSGPVHAHPTLWTWLPAQLAVIDKLVHIA